MDRALRIVGDHQSGTAAGASVGSRVGQKLGDALARCDCPDMRCLGFG